jgi:ABC-type phosphate transport system substrate-binding protein
MKKYRDSRIGYGVMALLLVVCCAFTQTKDKPKDEETEVAVIVNPANPIDAISLADLRKIFAGEKQSWGSPGPISLFVRGPGAREREVLLNRVLKMNESEYQQYWVRKVYSGEAPRQPLALLSNGMQLEAIRAERGAIALISVQDIHQGVKVVKVEGRVPGMNGYPLK